MRRDEIWVELVRNLKDAGISDYGIFLDPETNTLFAILRWIEGHQMDQLPKYKLMQRWSFMSNIMKIADDGAPIVERLNTCFTCLGESFPFISLFLIPKKIFFCSLRKINLVDFSSLYLNRYSSTVRVLLKRSCGVGNQISSSKEVEGKPLHFLIQVSGR